MGYGYGRGGGSDGGYDHGDFETNQLQRELEEAGYSSSEVNNALLDDLTWHTIANNQSFKQAISQVGNRINREDISDRLDNAMEDIDRKIIRDSLGD